MTNPPSPYQDIPVAPGRFIRTAAPSSSNRELGDLVESALSFVGITSSRVARWIGRECNCQERKEKLNALSVWAKRALFGIGGAEKKEKAVQALDYLTSNEEGDSPSQIPPPCVQ